MNMYAYAADPCFEKLLSDNRERYIQQSINTRYGQVAQLPRRDRDESGDCREHVNAEMCVWFSDLEDSLAERASRLGSPALLGS